MCLVYPSKCWIQFFGIIIAGFLWTQAHGEIDVKLEADLIYTVSHAPSIEVPSAVRELGRLQSVRGLRAIISRGDVLLLDLYREHYPLEEDQVLNAGIQDLIVEHFEKTEIRSKLLMFVAAQAYDSEELYGQMLKMVADESPLEDKVYWYELITHTDLSSVESGLLDNIAALGNKGKPHILEFLVQRKNPRVLAHLEAYVKTLNAIEPTRKLHQFISSLQSEQATQILVKLLDFYRHEPAAEFHTAATASLLRSLEDIPDKVNLNFEHVVKQLPYKSNMQVALAYISLSKYRRAPSAVPDMLTYLHQAGTYGAAYEALISMNNQQIWMQTRLEMDKAFSAGIFPEIFYKATTALLDERIENAHKYLSVLAGNKRIKMINDAIKQLEEKYALTSDPFADMNNYFWNYLHFLEELEGLPAKLALTENLNLIRKPLSKGYRKIGNYFRFIRRDPKKAIAYYDLAANNAAKEDRFKPYIDYMLSGETYLFDLGDKNQAINYYQAANSNLKKAIAAGNPSPAEIWMEKWLSVELDYLQKGKTFSGTLNGEQITGISFFAFLGTQYLDLESMGISIDKHDALVHLQQLPKTHLLFFDYIKALREEDQQTFTSKLGKIDPSGYWLTSYFGMIEYQTRLAKTKKLSTAMYTTMEENAGIQEAFASFKKSKKVKFSFNREKRAKRNRNTKLKDPGVTFALMKKALEKGDMKAFLACFSDKSRGRTLRMIKGMSRTDMNKMSRRLVLGDPISEFDNYLEFMVYSEEGIPASSVIFVLDAGEWKISDL